MTTIPDSCPKCSAEIPRPRKDTSSGEDIRRAACLECDWTQTYNLGTAMWKAMQIANQMRKKEEDDRRNNA